MSRNVNHTGRKAGMARDTTETPPEKMFGSGRGMRASHPMPGVTVMTDGETALVYKDGKGPAVFCLAQCETHEEGKAGRKKGK